MSSSKYQLVFSGKLLKGFKHAEVQKALAHLLKIPLDQAGHLIQGDRFRIKKALEKDKAERLLEKIILRGAECSVEPVRNKESKPIKSAAEADPVDQVDTELVDTSERLTLDFSHGGDASSVNDESPLTLDLPELTPDDDNTRPMAVVKPERSSGDEIVLASSPEVAEFKPEDDSENVGTFYERGVGTRSKDEEKSAVNKKNQLYIVLAGLIGVVVAAWLLMPMLMEEEPTPVVSTAPAVPVDPQRAQTLRRLEQLNRSVSVWMIQYGSGFNPAQVTLERLQQDLKMSEQDMLDGWGTALRFEPEAQVYRVISAGPDKEFGTGDELKRETATARK
ncbi:hypothetical protein [Sedimenticola selenatireducens]|uniref:Uncharacterized protein n=1 Tax=Sedimenticola selenatireducens TaxID=191960 RepID=A0A557SGY2_9GAMM|nr:hypothetical protein [Sedimenticola selenatireducens]TVO76665.1 hypothetical protein FHP88_04370 [Sedimenticola selenatireducens]TVT64108.1 MAG: hypothetical protein FHK78_07615 [Sedimenticola selenatireducens]